MLLYTVPESAQPVNEQIFLCIFISKNLISSNYWKTPIHSHCYGKLQTHSSCTCGKIAGSSPDWITKSVHWAGIDDDNVIVQR